MAKNKTDKPKILERDVQKGIIDFLAFRHIFHYRNNTGAAVIQPANGPRRFLRAGALGSPDIVVIIGGKYIGIEVKRPGGVLRESQIAFRNAVNDAGGLYWVFDSIDSAVDHIQNYLNSHHD